MAILCTAPAQAQSATQPRDKTEANYAAHKGDFDYLLGDWEFITENKQFGKLNGRWSAVRLVTGQILDEYRVLGNDGATVYLSSTVRSYNAVAERWELIGMVEGSGLQDFGTGQRTGDEVRIEQRFGVAGGKPTTLRIHYYNIQPDRFSWSADRSNDGGKTWVENSQHIEAHRIGPARSLGALAPAPQH